MDYKNIPILIGSMFLVAVGYTMVIPFLPLYLLEIGVAESEVGFWSGLVFSVCFLVAGIMGPVWGKLADSGGKKKMAVRAGVLLSISYVFCGMAQDEYQLLGARAFQGVANGYVAAAMAIISASAAPNKLGLTLGLAQTALLVGGICGPLVGGVVSHMAGMKNSFYIAAVLLGIVRAAVIFFVREPTEISDEKTEDALEKKDSLVDDLRYAYGNLYLKELLVITFALQCTILMIQPVTALYVGQLLGTLDNVEVTAGFIMSAGGIAGALTTALWGKFGQEHGYYLVMMITSMAAGIITVLQAIPDNIWGFAACQFLVGCFIIGLNPSLNAALVKYTPASFHGRVFGLSSAAQQFGNMAGPLIAAGIMSSALWHVYLLAGIIQFVIGGGIYWRHVRKGELGK